MNSSSVSAAKTADNGVKGRSGAARAGQGRYAADGSRRLRGTPAERSGFDSKVCVAYLPHIIPPTTPQISLACVSIGNT